MQHFRKLGVHNISSNLSWKHHSEIKNYEIEIYVKFESFCSPGYGQTCHWLCKMLRFLSFLRIGFNSLKVSMDRKRDKHTHTRIQLKTIILGLKKYLIFTIIGYFHVIFSLTPLGVILFSLLRAISLTALDLELQHWGSFKLNQICPMFRNVLLAICMYMLYILRTLHMICALLCFVGVWYHSTLSVSFRGHQCPPVIPSRS